MLEILARSGVLQVKDEDFVVMAGKDDPLPGKVPPDPEAFLTEVAERFPHATNEVGLFRRCAGALPEVLRGNEDPLSLLFGDAEPQAGDLYRRAPVWRAANRMLGEVVRTLVDELPDGRQLRVLEVGAGIGSATECILPELPAGRFDYMYTDISAGFFAEAEARFSAGGTPIDYQVLDVEKDPVDQGFEFHAYDMIIAANVLHATRYLDETLAYCRMLLAPSGLLVALENQRGRGWMDLIFGQLGRLVAFRRSLPRRPRPRGTRRVASGARRYRFYGKRSPRRGSAGSGQFAGSRGDRGTGSDGGRIA